MPLTNILWKPWSEENFQNPYPMYSILRETDPVHQAQTGEWIITRYDDVKSILKDPRFIVGNRLEWLKRGIAHLNNKDVDFQSIADAMNCFILFLNPPQHTRIRKFIITVWSNYQVEPIISDNINTLLQQLPKDRFDLVADFAQQLPALTMTRILGIAQRDYKKLKSYARSLIKALDLYITVKDLVTIHSASKDFIQHFRSILQKQEFSDDGLLSKIYHENKALPEPLSENELISICIFMFTAGEETTSSLIGTGIFNILSNPSSLNEIRKISPDPWDSAIDELLRFDPPVQLLGRIASEDFILNGKEIKKGSTTTLCLGSANRDAAIFEEPNLLKLGRQQNRHLAFGSGIHFCLGDWLGKLQGKMAIKSMLEKNPTLTLESTMPHYSRNLAIRSLEKLPVVIS